MQHLFIDTNAFRQDPQRNSSAWKALARLGKYGTVQIHVSEVTERELCTHLEDEFRRKVQAALNAAKDLRQMLPDHVKYQDFRELVQEVAKQQPEVAQAVKEFIGSVNGVIHPFRPEHGVAALNDYFTGGPPFSAVKARKDFPDAFIWQAIADLLKKVKSLHVVTADANFGKELGKIKGVSVHESIEDFVMDPEIEKLVLRTENLEWFVTFVTATHARASARTVARQVEDQLHGHSVGGIQDDYEATISSFGEVREVSFDHDAVNDYGEGLFAIPFTARSECLIDYYLPKWVYHGMETRRPHHAEDWNDYVYQVEQECDLSISGTVTIEIEPGQLEASITKLKEWAELLTTAEITVEVDEVYVDDEELLGAIGS